MPKTGPFAFPARAFPEDDLPGGGDDVGEAEDAPDQDYYVFLNVKADCSDDELKMAYRKLALIWHPDRHTDPEARAHATAKFARLTHIHDTLTNPTKRRLYNLYGEKGLSSGLEVGAHLPTAEQIRAAYAKHQRVVRQERELARLGLSGVLQTTVSLAQWPPLLRLLLPDSPDVVQFRGKGARSVGRMGPSGMQLRSSMLAERFATQLSRKDAVEVAGQMIVQGQQGGGLVSFMLKRSFSPRSGAKVRMHWGMEDSPLALSTFRALSASTVAKIHMRLSAAGSQLRCACSRQVSAAVLGKLQYIIGGTESGVKLRAHRQGERGTARAEAWIGFGAFSLSASLARRLSKRSGLSATLNLGQGGAQVEVGMRRRISARSSFAAACALSLAKGVTLKLSLGRMNQDLSVPLLLSPLVTLRSVVVGAVLPALAGALLKIVWLAPRQRRRKERRRQRLRSEHAESVARAREEARGDIELMRGAVGRKRATESARNGLVIVRAVFGRLPPRQDSDLHWPPEPNPAETGGAGDTVDVTIPLQYLAEDSKLQLFNSSKAGLPGFFDPVPGEAKELYVLYRFRGRLHEVTGADEAPLCIPLQRDALPESTSRFLAGESIPSQAAPPPRRAAAD